MPNTTSRAPEAQPKHFFVQRVHRGRAMKLYRRRHGRADAFLTDDDEGRRFLKALLAYGLPHEDVMLHVAPWITEAELRALVRAARSMKLDGTTVGRELRLTDAERRALELWPWWPTDKPKDVVRREGAQRKVAARRLARAMERDGMRTVKRREVALLCIMHNARPVRFGVAVSDLIDRAMAMTLWPSKNPPALTAMDPFRRPDGRRPMRASASTLIHRTLDQLVKRGLLKSKLRPGVRGPARYVSVRNENAVAQLVRTAHAAEREYRHAIAQLPDAPSPICDHDHSNHSASVSGAGSETDNALENEPVVGKTGPFCDAPTFAASATTSATPHGARAMTVPVTSPPAPKLALGKGVAPLFRCSGQPEG